MRVRGTTTAPRQRHDGNDIQEINELLLEKNAIDAAAEKSTTQISMEQTIATSGMSGAIVSLRRLNETIHQAGIDFQDSLDKYYAQKKLEAIFKLAFAVANLATASRAPLGMIGDMWKKKKAGVKISKAIEAGTKFAKSAKNVSKAALGLALISANRKLRDKKFPSSTAVTLTNNVMKDLADVPIPDDIPDGEEMATLQAALDSLNKELPQMGSWASGRSTTLT